MRLVALNDKTNYVFFPKVLFIRYNLTFTIIKKLKKNIEYLLAPNLAVALV